MKEIIHPWEEVPGPHNDPDFPAQSRYEIRYGDAGDGSCCEGFSRVADLQRRMEELRVKYRAILRMPYSVDLYRRGTLGHLSVGMGDNGDWLITFFPPLESYKAPLYSLGNPDAIGFNMYWFGDHTPMSWKYVISRAAAEGAIREWLLTGVRSRRIQWTDMMYLANDF